MNYSWVWAIVIVVCLVLEFLTVGDLIAIWFACSGLVSLILSFCGVGSTIQIIVFVVVAFILLLSLRRYVSKMLEGHKQNTNLDLIVSKNVKLITAITDNGKGTAKINDVVWNCISEDSKPIDAGEIVQIVKIEGTKLIVKKI